MPPSPEPARERQRGGGDVGGWRDGDAAVRASIAAELDAACREVGFLQLRGHGIPDGVVGAVLAEAGRCSSGCSGTVFAEHEYEGVWKLVRHEDAKVRLAVPEMLDWLRSLDPAAEQPDPEYPFVAAAGQRRAHNANRILRDPAWRKSDPDGALRVHRDDLVALGATAGGWVAVETRAGRLVARAEADDGLRRGYVSLPHGYGQAYPDAGGERLTDGPRVNLITSADDCGPIAATPHHRNVAVRLVAVTGPEADAAEERSRRVAALADAPAAG